MQQLSFRVLAALCLLGGVTMYQTQLARGAFKLNQKPSQQPTVTTVTSVAVAQPAPPPVDVNGSFIDQGQRRTYYLHTPPSYQQNQPMPLVMAFHGSGEQGKDMAAQTALNKLADQEGFIVVYPDGLNKKWNVSGVAPEDNVKFVHTLIANISQIRSLNQSRIYAVGLSNGGILVQKLACENPSQIAAFATVAASLPVQFQPHCQTQTPVPMLMINSTADKIVPWDGGASPQVRVGRNLSIPPIPEVINFWRQHDACPAEADVEQLSQGRVQVSHYQNCQAGSEVTLMMLKGGGHIWPGGSYGQSQYLDATTTVWNFFQQHALTSIAQK